MNITETPDKWIILKINNNGEIYYKVFATWVGGYLGNDSWRINSGIAEVSQDKDYYYFTGFSGSVYQCYKKAYGITTVFNWGILDKIIKLGEGKITALPDKPNWELFIKACKGTKH